MHRMLGISYKSTWFMTHRLREAMRVGGLAPLGGSGKAVESDETFIGRLEGQPKRRGGGGRAHKNTVLTLVERGGSARSFHVDGSRFADIAPIVRENIKRETTLMTDEGTHYVAIGQEFARHGTVTHRDDEYVRYVPGEDHLFHTNTAENYYSIFKRGMKGVYQHCSEKHLHRYLAEFDFRYSSRVALGVDDETRAKKLAKGIVGKRLTYRRPNREGEAPPF